jgi:Ca2+-binding EF-hand superfamily protein
MTQLTSGGLSGSNNAQLASSRGDMMSMADANNDGALSYEEFSSMKPSDVSDEQSQSLFSSADTDSDGSLSSDEVSKFESGMKPPMGAMMGPPPPPPSDSDDDDDSTTVSSILSKLIDSLQSSDSTTDTTETETSSTDTTDEQQKIFNFFDQDGDGTVSDDKLNTGVTALKTAMSNYLISLQESRAAA